MARKPARMYRQVKGQAYTRREYMGGVPAIRVAQFEMGNARGKFPMKVSLECTEACQIRNIALESARVSANRVMMKRAGHMNYFLKLRIFPHHILRENKQATGAGADRVSEGMRRSFGKNVGSAARIKADQKVITVHTTEDRIDVAKEALRKASMKLPSPCRIIVES
jgi:large subunit ribosomal protein L10e